MRDTKNIAGKNASDVFLYERDDANGRLQTTIKRATTQRAEINADLKVMQAEMKAGLQATYDAMMNAQFAGDQKAYNAAAVKYKADFEIVRAKNEAAKLRAENKVNAVNDTVIETAMSLQEKVNSNILQTKKEFEGVGELSGPVEITPPPNASPEQIAQTKAYIEGSNQAIQAGKLSPAGRVSTAGSLRIRANAAVAKERARAAAAGTPYKGHVGHVPDTTWTGSASPYSWLDLDPSVNMSIGGQANRYPIGYKPTEFSYRDR